MEHFPIWCVIAFSGKFISDPVNTTDITDLHRTFLHTEFPNFQGSEIGKLSITAITETKNNVRIELNQHIDKV